MVAATKCVIFYVTIYCSHVLGFPSHSKENMQLKTDLEVDPSKQLIQSARRPLGDNAETTKFYEKELFRKMQLMNSHDIASKTIKPEIRFIQPVPDHDSWSLRFNITSFNEPLDITLAELTLTSLMSTDRNVTISTSKKVLSPSRYKSILKYNVTGFVQRRILSGNLTVEFNVEFNSVSNNENSFRDLIINLQPTLVIFKNVNTSLLNTMQNTRKRRALSTPSPEPSQAPNDVANTETPIVTPTEPGTSNTETPAASSNSICRLKSWTVRFEELGWNWVLAPAEYQANICSGRCPSILSSSMNITNHTLLKNLYMTANVNDRSNIPTACCIPVEYQSLTMLLHEEDGNVVISNIADMVVTKCGCR